MKMPIIKIIFAGEAGVGKTSLVTRLKDRIFREHYIRTQDVNVYTIKYNVGNREIYVGLRDPQGHRPILHYVRDYLRKAYSAIMIFDINRPYTFYELPYRISKFTALSPGRPFVLVGNKKDLREFSDYYVTEEEGKAFAEELSEIYGFPVPYIETSAKTGEGVEEMLKTAIALALKAPSLRRPRGSVFPSRASR